ncbi:MAG: hypothetical protein FJ214_06665 [Ignavibacteria bacterium]|nr:hypothetical protein [Ignavibacteria bacterium]
MIITLQDRSNYLKGLLVLIGKDRILKADEKFIFKEIGKVLQFAPEFIDQSLEDFLENENISHDPPIFQVNLLPNVLLRMLLK